jgi:serine/threonine protein phosphatase 1
MGKIIAAISDVHGMFEQLKLAAIDAVAEADHIVFLGDYIDRGPQSKEVVNLVRMMQQEDPEGVDALMGNHEQMMIEFVLHNRDWGWPRSNNGGPMTLKSYGDDPVIRDDAKWMSQLPLHIETNKYVFVHAGFDPNYSWKSQVEDDEILWRRGWEHKDYDFGKFIVYGHTPRDTPLILKHSAGLDTGAVFGGKLTVGYFDDEIGGGPIKIKQY